MTRESGIWNCCPITARVITITASKPPLPPNEAHLVPPGITKVYNVGESSVDMNSLYNIADKLGVYEEFAAKEANEARGEYYFINSSMDKLLNDKREYDR